MTNFSDTTFDPGSQYDGTHARTALPTMTDMLTHGAVPGLPEGIRHAIHAPGLIDELQRQQFETVLTNQQNQAATLATELLTSLMSGEAVPSFEAFSRRVHDAHQELTDEVARSEALNTARNQVKTTQAARIGALLPDALSAIREHVAAVMDQARHAVDALNGLDYTDASAVAQATTNQRKAVTELPKIAARYNQLRHAQYSLLVLSDVGAVGQTPHSPTHGTRAWLDVIASGLLECRGVTRVDHGPSHDLTPTARMITLVSRGDVWVPSLDEAEERYDEIWTRASGRVEGDWNPDAPMVDISTRNWKALNTPNAG